jgi:hypothetical protein
MITDYEIIAGELLGLFCIIINIAAVISGFLAINRAAVCEIINKWRYAAVGLSAITSIIHLIKFAQFHFSHWWTSGHDFKWYFEWYVVHLGVSLAMIALHLIIIDDSGTKNGQD